MSPVFGSIPTTIFEEMSLRAKSRGAINLGQGFPDSDGPEDVRKAAAEATMNGWNQYPPSRGTADLRAAIAVHYAHHQELEIKPETDVLVTSGATEALAASILGLIAPGDEVLLFQPAYDAYAPLIREAGGMPLFATLSPPDWRISDAILEANLSDNLRAVIINSPLNPTGSMLDEAELSRIARFCVAHDLIAICDEVWEHLVFDGQHHRSLLDMPGMADRTVKIGSAGKIFSLTGWKVGWAIGSPALIDNIAKAHQFLTFTTPPNLQAGVTYGLAKTDSYFTEMRASFQASRDRLTAALEGGGFALLPNAATYFLAIDLPASNIEMDDRNFCNRMVDEAGVAAIPVSAFFETDKLHSIVRICFAKNDGTLDDAADRMIKFRRNFA